MFDDHFVCASVGGLDTHSGTFDVLDCASICILAQQQKYICVQETQENAWCEARFFFRSKNVSVCISRGEACGALFDHVHLCCEQVDYIF